MRGATPLMRSMPTRARPPRSAAPVEFDDGARPAPPEQPAPAPPSPLVHRVARASLVWLVSWTFALPLVGAMLLRRVAATSVVAALALALGYAVVSYDGCERRDGRVALRLTAWWPICHGYFPVRLHFAAEGVVAPSGGPIDPRWGARLRRALPTRERAHVLAFHPHGPFPLGASVVMPNLVRLGRGLGDDVGGGHFDRVRMATASAVFALPLVRDMYLSLGCVSADRATLRGVLARGHTVGILPGGEREQLLVAPHEAPTEPLVRPRDGLLRLALEARAPIVPVFVFGKRRAYGALSVGASARVTLARRFRIGVPAAYGFVCAPFMPRAVPIDVVFGGALDVARFVDGDGGAPSAAQVEALREAYCEAVAALFESHKHQFGYGHKRVEWIDHRSVDAKCQ